LYPFAKSEGNHRSKVEEAAVVQERYVRISVENLSLPVCLKTVRLKQQHGLMQW